MAEKATALLVATMDTKAREAAYLKECLEGAGVAVLIMDAGIRGQSPIKVDISRDEVARAGGIELAQAQQAGHEGKALAMMIKGAVALAQDLERQGKVQGVLGLGGSMGTTLGTAVMRGLAVGVPKVMISTMASRDTRPFVGTKDILMLHAVCDLSGLNRITRQVLANGALAMAGMLRGPRPGRGPARPLAALSTLGTTEACVQQVRQWLEDRGYEAVVFHTVGAGGQAMDELISSGEVNLVVELSLHEITDHLLGGDYDAGPERAKAALRQGVPTLLVPGNMDFLVSGPLEQAQARFPDSQFHQHNAAITVLKTTNEQTTVLARALAQLCQEAAGPVSLMVPQGGLSAFGAPGGPFHDPENAALFVSTLRQALPNGYPLQVLDQQVNDPQFGQALCRELERLLA